MSPLVTAGILTALSAVALALGLAIFSSYRRDQRDAGKAEVETELEKARAERTKAQADILANKPSVDETIDDMHKGDF